MSLDVCLSRRIVLWGPLALMFAGCHREPDNTPIPADQQGLRELAAAYRDFFRMNKRGPKDLKELQAQGQSKGKKAKGPGQAYPNAVQMVSSGALVVQWGAPLLPEGANPDAVLAYLKTVPEQGGSVLMQDGNTITTMTADEFKAAPKAASR